MSVSIVANHYARAPLHVGNSLLVCFYTFIQQEHVKLIKSNYKKCFSLDVVLGGPVWFALKDFYFK